MAGARTRDLRRLTRAGWTVRSAVRFLQVNGVDDPDVYIDEELYEANVELAAAGELPVLSPEHSSVMTYIGGDGLEHEVTWTDPPLDHLPYGYLDDIEDDDRDSFVAWIVATFDLLARRRIARVMAAFDLLELRREAAAYPRVRLREISCTHLAPPTSVALVMSLHAAPHGPTAAQVSHRAAA